MEDGAGERPMKVNYDRAGSAISEMEPGAIDFPAAFANASWFHLSGITPALSQNTAQACQIALDAAHLVGAKISFARVRSPGENNEHSGTRALNQQ